jgi:hypothetical protein
MTTTGVLAGSVGEGGRNDARDVKLVRRLLDDRRARAENWAFVPLRRPGDPSLSEADWRAAFAVACGGCASGFERCRAPGLFAMGERRIEPTPGGTAPGFPARRG